MDMVYIVYSVDANDETTIYRVFSSYDSAKSYRDELKSSCRPGSFEKFYIDEEDVWK